jgi:hypothetical protein
VALWGVPQAENAPNAYVLRGRTTHGERIIYNEVPLLAGQYSLKVPHQSKAWYVAVEEPGHSPTVVGPIEVALNEKKALDIACVHGGSIRGRVNAVPKALEGELWVVAFSKCGYRAETRVRPDGAFQLGELPAGEFGLKVGHDAFTDRETQVKWPGMKPQATPPTKQEQEAFNKAWNAPANPWKRAKLVQVESGREVTDVELDLPAQ